MSAPVDTYPFPPEMRVEDPQEQLEAARRAEPAPTPRPAPAYTLELNEDGSAVVRLRDPVKHKGELVARLTIPRLTGRHMQAATWRLFEVPTLGQVMAWASNVVLPEGVLDELGATLARDIATEVALILSGKSQATGGPRSPT